MIFVICRLDTTWFGDKLTSLSGNIIEAYRCLIFASTLAPLLEKREISSTKKGKGDKNTATTLMDRYFQTVTNALPYRK